MAGAVVLGGVAAVLAGGLLSAAPAGIALTASAPPQVRNAPDSAGGPQVPVGAWRLESVVVGGDGLRVHPQADTTLRIAPGGDFRIDSCNLMYGTVDRIDDSLRFADAFTRTAKCAAPYDRADALLHAALAGPVRWFQDRGTLLLIDTQRRVTVEFAALESNQPPMDADLVGEADSPAISCQALARDTPRGPRIWVIYRAGTDDVWRPDPAGPYSPQDGPISSAPNFAPAALKQHCLLGFAPRGAAGIRVSGHGAPQRIPVGPAEGRYPTFLAIVPDGPGSQVTPY